MLLDKRSLLMAKAASKDDSRLSIQGVRIEADGTGVATDGHILFKFTPDKDTIQDPKDYPTLEGVNPVGAPANGNEGLHPFTIPTRDALDIAKAVPKRNPLPILEYIALDEQRTNDNGSACFGVTDLDSPRVFSPRKIDADFPDHSKLWPKGKATVRIGLDVDKLDIMVQVLKAAGVEAISLEIHDPLSAMVVRSDMIKDGGTVTGLVMPRRLEKGE